MRYLVAVSGGIDSVVLLDQLVRLGKHELIVAHFDHGIREDSAADGRFVQGLAFKYHLPFVTKREELGAHASEERARSRRYAFLRQAAVQHDGIIATAHHGDDIVETIAINIMRGTGWRGVAVFGNTTIVRPVLHLTKANIRAYALSERLEWVEDSTNTGVQYLRNRVRQTVALRLPRENAPRIRAVRQRQMALRAVLDKEAGAFMQPNGEYDRYLFTQIDAREACELLRAAITARQGMSPTRPQVERALLAIKTARANTRYEVGGGVLLRFTVHTFIVQTP